MLNLYIQTILSEILLKLWEQVVLLQRLFSERKNVSKLYPQCTTTIFLPFVYLFIHFVYIQIDTLHMNSLTLSEKRHHWDQKVPTLRLKSFVTDEAKQDK